jgi:hypothetical protein
MSVWIGLIPLPLMVTLIVTVPAGMTLALTGGAPESGSEGHATRIST